MCSISTSSLSGEDDDEDIHISSANSNQLYSDELDSDMEDELYQKIYYSNCEEPESVTNVSTSNCTSGSSADDHFDGDIKSRNKKSRKVGGSPFVAKFHNSVAEVIQISSSDSSDDSIILVDSWDDPHADIVINVDESNPRSSNSIKYVSTPLRGIKSENFIPITTGCASTESSTSGDDNNVLFFNSTPFNEKLKKPKSKNKKLLKKKLEKEVHNDWHIDPEDHNSSYKKLKRYYKESDTECRRCKEKGHTAARCTNSGSKKCYLCGGSHVASDCNNRLCGVCLEKGHSHVRCSRHLKSKLCGLCKMVGHLSNRCPDIWRRYHLTTDTSSGIVRSTEKNNDKSKYCFNCGLKGHLGHQCAYQRCINSRMPASPYVMSYEHPELFSDGCTPNLRKNRFRHPKRKWLKRDKRNNGFTNRSSGDVLMNQNIDGDISRQNESSPDGDISGQNQSFPGATPKKKKKRPRRRNTIHRYGLELSRSDFPRTPDPVSIPAMQEIIATKKKLRQEAYWYKQGMQNGKKCHIVKL